MTRNNMSLFITFEGVEGSGKTTIAKLVVDKLVELGYKVLYTREPGGSEIAEQIRNIILNKKNINLDPKTEALLFAASRRQHLVEKILPALKQGYIVISDRYIDSSLAYQGAARSLGIDEIKRINDFAVSGKYPDLTVFLDVAPEIGLNRIAIDKGREVNRLDVETLAFHNKVYQGYLSILKSEFPRIQAIDASKTTEETLSKAIELVLNYIKKCQ